MEGIWSYVTNERGERTKVILDVTEYERLIKAAERAEDIRVAREELAKLERGETQRTRRVPRTAR